MDGFAKICIAHYCCYGGDIQETGGTTFQLHEFCDASNRALFFVVYLRRIVNGRSSVAFNQGKTEVVILRKKLEAVKNGAELMLTVSKSLQHLVCSLHFCSDSQVVLK